MNSSFRILFREQLRGVLEIFSGGDHVDQITSRQHKLGIPDDQDHSEISDHENVIGDLDDNPINQSFENYRDGRTGKNKFGLKPAGENCFERRKYKEV